ncbi:hypothetical protein ACLI4Y_07725 [Natrialbaceae archaeon A-CW3]
MGHRDRHGGRDVSGSVTGEGHRIQLPHVSRTDRTTADGVHGGEKTLPNDPIA